MHYTAAGHSACVEALLHAGNIDVNKQDDDGFTALMFAADSGMIHKLKYASAIDCCRTLMKLSSLSCIPVTHSFAGLSSPVAWEMILLCFLGIIALHCTAAGHTACVEALLSAVNIDVNMQQKNGGTALFLATVHGTVHRFHWIQHLRHRQLPCTSGASYFLLHARHRFTRLAVTSQVA